MVFARGEGEFLFLLLFLSLLLVEDGRSEGQRAMRCRLGCVATKNLEFGGVPAMERSHAHTQTLITICV
jgi:hypothetical protein